MMMVMVSSLYHCQFVPPMKLAVKTQTAIGQGAPSGLATFIHHKIACIKKAGCLVVCTKAARLVRAASFTRDSIYGSIRQKGILTQHNLSFSKK